MEKRKHNRQEQKVLRTQGKKCCPKCLDIKPLEDFRKKGTLKNGESNYGICLPCHSVNSKGWNEKNPEYRMQRYYDMSEVQFETIRQYYLTYRKTDTFKEKRNYKRKIDLGHRFDCQVRDHLKGVKSIHEFKDLWDEVYQVYDMYNIPYHIDHMVPQNWFLVKTPKYLINHLDNLQVIDAKYNLSKGDRWSDPVPSDYLDKIRPYIKKKFEGLLKSL